MLGAHCSLIRCSSAWYVFALQDGDVIDAVLVSYPPTISCAQPCPCSARELVWGQSMPMGPCCRSKSAANECWGLIATPVLQSWLLQQPLTRLPPVIMSGKIH